MILSLVDLQECQLFPQYCYVSNNNKHVKKDEERMIICLTTIVIADRTRSKFTIDCRWANTLTSIPVNVVAKCKEHVIK